MSGKNKANLRDQSARCSAPQEDFGELLTSRGYEGWPFVWRMTIAILLALFALMFVAVAIWAPPSKGSKGPDWMGSVFMAALMGGLAYFFLRQIMTACDFYESGFVKRAWVRTSEYPYAGVEWFTYNLVRQYHNGMYAGTALSLTMKLDDGRKVSYSGKHKEKKKGFLIKTRFEGEDEMDLVREAIEIHVAERIEKQLASEGQVDWCGKAALTPDGIIPKKGKHKGTLVPWLELQDVWFKNGQMAVSSVSEPKKAMVSIPCMGKNFFAVEHVFKRYIEHASGKELPKPHGAPKTQSTF